MRPNKEGKENIVATTNYDESYDRDIDFSPFSQNDGIRSEHRPIPTIHARNAALNFKPRQGHTASRRTSWWRT